MATIVNTPSGGDGSQNGMLMGIVLVLLLVVAIVYFGMPYMRGGSTTMPAPANTTNYNAPVIDTTTPSSKPEEKDDSGAQLNIPERIEVNVNGSMGATATPAAPSASPLQE